MFQSELIIWRQPCRFARRRQPVGMLTSVFAWDAIEVAGNGDVFFSVAGVVCLAHTLIHRRLSRIAEAVGDDIELSNVVVLL